MRVLFKEDGHFSLWRLLVQSLFRACSVLCNLEIGLLPLIRHAAAQLVFNLADVSHITFSRLSIASHIRLKTLTLTYKWTSTYTLRKCSTFSCHTTRALIFFLPLIVYLSPGTADIVLYTLKTFKVL